MKSFKPALLLLLVFLAGIVVGVIGTRAVVRQVIRSVVANPNLFWTRIERTLTADLKLNAEQRARVHQILAETHDRVKTLRNEYQPRLLPVIEQARSDINAALTSEQRAKFDKMLKEKERLWKR